MMKLLRFVYKVAQYGIILLLSKWYTVFFRFQLILNGASYGNGIRCYNSIPALLVNRTGRLEIGNNVIFNSYTDHSWNCRCKLVVRPHGELSIGDNSGMNGVMIYCNQRVSIKDNVKIGGGTRITDSNHHSLDYFIRRDLQKDAIEAKSAPIQIDNDVFIGANCYIGKGVTIGERSIIAAGSVVVKSIPSDEIWGGNPAMFIKRIK